MANENVNIYINARDNASAAFSKAGQAARRLTGQIKRQRSVLQNVVGTWGNLYSGMKQALETGIALGSWLSGYTQDVAALNTQLAREAELLTRIEAVQDKQRARVQFDISLLDTHADKLKALNKEIDQARKNEIGIENQRKTSGRRFRELSKERGGITSINGVDVRSQDLKDAQRQLENDKKRAKRASEYSQALKEQLVVLQKVAKHEQEKIARLAREKAIAEEVRMVHVRKMATNKIKAHEEALAERRISRQIEDLRDSMGVAQGQNPDLQATQSRFLTRGSVRSTDPVASALKKQIEQLEDQLKIMQDQAEDTAAIRRSMELQEEFDGI